VQGIFPFAKSDEAIRKAVIKKGYRQGEWDRAAGGNAPFNLFA
jgi:hypothetical protein